MTKARSSENLASIQTKYTDSNFIAKFANQRFFSAVEYFIQLVQANTILDAGCGEAVILELASLHGFKSVAGMDFDISRLVEAHERLKTNYIQADIHTIPLSESSFELVICLEVLEHVGSPQQALRELKRVTTKYVLISVPHEPWWRIGNMARLKYLSDWGNTPEHINHWTRKGIVQLIARDFKILEIRNPFLWTFVLAEKR